MRKTLQLPVEGPTDGADTRQVVATEPRARHRWPNGFLGWLAYLHDHRLHGFQRPVNWFALHAFEESATAVYLCANGGAMVLDGFEVEALRLWARGLDDASIAQALDVRIASLGKLRFKINASLGIASTAELVQLATAHGIK